MANPGAAKFKELFCEEAEEGLATLSRIVLELEHAPGSLGRYQELMRTAHTIKGAAATMGYTNIAHLAHALEDIFHLGERGAFQISPKTATVALTAIDRLGQAVSAIKERDEEIPTDDMITAIRALIAEGEASASVPATAASAPAEQERGSTAARISGVSHVRVSTDRLDTLLGIYEELLMLRLKLDVMLDSANETLEEITDQRLRQRLFFINEFKLLSEEFKRLLGEVEGELLTIRLVPLDHIFGQFPRMVRDLSLAEGKKVEFNVTGGGVELDRTVLEGLGGALAHILRNAVDHGIEKEGRITLTAQRKSGRVEIVVEDNGGGIDYARVREVAVKRGVLTKESAAAARESELRELLFHPNMSTSEQVTEISGRGVGLSAVRSFTTDVGGRISVESPIASGRGTRFVLDLPISLATLQVLLVDVRGFTFAIPFSSTERTIGLKEAVIVSTGHQRSVLVEGEPIPILRLEDVLHLSFGYRPDKEDELAALVIVNTGESRAAFLVDRCSGKQELLVKALPPVLRDIMGFSGSTILADGRTILLLDAYGLLAKAVGDILKGTGAK